jgi:hypothetical protein
MKINFECEGGFIHLPLKYQVNTDALPTEIKQKLISLVDSSDIFNLNHDALESKSHGPPDVVRYRLDLSDTGRSQSLVVDDATASPALRPLLSFLRNLALKQNR